MFINSAFSYLLGHLFIVRLSLHLMLERNKAWSLQSKDPEFGDWMDMKKQGSRICDTKGSRDTMEAKKSFIHFTLLKNIC